jgi:Fe-S-cluster containining protein
MQTWQSRHTETEEENRKFLLRQARLNAKDMNIAADEIHKEVFTRIDCLECANCCKSIPPMVNPTDSRRIAHHLKLSESLFAQKFLRCDEDGDTVINHSPCPFLEADNKCRIYEVRPKACREYPHTDKRQFIKNIRLHLQNSHYCPAVFHILEQLKKKFS